MKLSPPLLPLAIALLLAGWHGMAETLVQGDGTRLEAPRFEYRDGQFRDGPHAWPRAAVADWWLGSSSPTATGTVPAPAAVIAASTAATAVADAATRERLLALRQAGEQLAARFPGCGGVQVLDVGEFRLTADHHHRYSYHFAGLILNEKMLDWGVVNLPFTEGRSRARLLTARCLTRDGRVLELPPDAGTVAPVGGGDVYFSPNARQLSAAVPGTELGALVEYEFEIEEYQPENWRLFFPSFYFQGEVPVCISRLTVGVPEDVRLWSWTVNWDAAGESAGFWGRLGRTLLPWTTSAETRSEEIWNGVRYRQHVWEKRDVPPISPEPQMPALSEVTPAVHATIVDRWMPLNAFVGGLQQERLVPQPAVTAKAKEIVGDATTADDQIARLYYWVQKNIRYLSIKSSLSSGWSGHPAAETLANGYGDCTDKAVLFAVMLRSIGVEADPVVLKTQDSGLFFPEYPVIFGNHCITELRRDGRSQFLDATTQDHRYPSWRADDHGALAVNFLRDRRQVIPIPPGLEAMGKITDETMTLTPDGALDVVSHNHYAGEYEAGLRGAWKRVPEKLRPQLMAQYVNRLAPGAKLKRFEMSDPQDLARPFTLDYDYTLPAYAIPAGTMRIVQLPDREHTFNEISMETRRYPLAYPTATAWERHVHLKLPTGWKLLSPPPDLRLSGDGVHYQERFTPEPGGIAISLSFARDGIRVPADDYSGFRHQLQIIERQTRRPLYLETAP
ncbi:MAG: DUF3857 and transglutaminase domain-containing protein [bacterium]